MRAAPAPGTMIVFEGVTKVYDPFSISAAWSKYVARVRIHGTEPVPTWVWV